jgi:hypothetical protein
VLVVTSTLSETEKAVRNERGTTVAYLIFFNETAEEFYGRNTASSKVIVIEHKILLHQAQLIPQPN